MRSKPIGPTEKRSAAIEVAVPLLACALSSGFCKVCVADTLERNWALHGSVSQSSTYRQGTYPQGEATQAIDGNRDGNWNAGSVTHTWDEDQPYWQVDLGASYRVDRIRIYNRTDCCKERLSNFAIFYLDTDEGFKYRSFDSTSTQTHVNTIPVFLPEDIIIGADPKTGFTGTHFPGHEARLGGERARFIRIQLAGHGVLSLAEVEVTGQYDIAGPPAIADAVTWQKTAVSVQTAAALTATTNKLILFSNGPDDLLHATVDFQTEQIVGNSPILASATPGTAWDVGSGHLFAAGIGVGRRKAQRQIWIADSEIGTPQLINTTWESVGTGSGPPAIVTACGKLVATWRSGATIQAAWRATAPGAAWSSAQQVGQSAGTNPSIAANASGDVAVAFLTARNGLVVFRTLCSDSTFTWDAAFPPTGQFSGKVALAAFGDLFEVAGLQAGGQAVFSIQQPTAGHPWIAYEPFVFTGPPLAEAPTLFVFSGITLAATRGTDGTMRYFVRTPNSVKSGDGWIGGGQIALGGSGDLPPMLAEVGVSTIDNLKGSPSDLFIARRNVSDHVIYALNLGRFIASETVTHTFGLQIGVGDTSFAHSQWGDIANITNIYEHMVALLSLPRPAWAAVASKQCGPTSEATHMVIPPSAGGTAHPYECPMRIWQDGTSAGAVSLPTGGLMHEWMHVDFAQRDIANWPDFAQTFRFSASDDIPADNGLRACKNNRHCEGDPCERAGDDHGGTRASTTDFAVEETTLRRWDQTRICVSGLDGPAGRRYQGGYALYDIGTNDHALIHTTVGYRWYGEELRDMIVADESHGNTQLRQRYNWIRDHYFNGIEYNGRRADALPQTNRSLGYTGMPNQ